MRRSARGLRYAGACLLGALLLLLTACGGAEIARDDTTRAADTTEIVFLPSLRAAHPREEGYSFAYLRRLITAIQPDTVLVEIPPAVFTSVVGASDARSPGVPAEHPWLTRHPELSEVVLPLRRRLRYELVPVSGWTPAAHRDFEAYFAAHPEGPDVDYYRRALRAVRVMTDEHDPREEPEYALSPSYRRLAGWPRQALSTAAEDELGAAGPRRLVHAHYALMRQAIARHTGERLLVIFDAADAWYLVPRLRRLPNTRYIDARAFAEELDED